MADAKARALGRRALVQGACAALIVTRAPVVRAEERGPLLIVPLGAVTGLEIGVVERALRAFYSLEVRVGERMRLPAAAYYPRRSRYRAERLLTHLERSTPANAHRVLGLASVDISTTKGDVEDWGILGLATMDGRVGVLSSFRCRRKATGPAQVAQRLGKTAVHEVGHTFGLDHCPNLGCLMEDGQGSVLTSDREFELCAACRATLKAAALLKEPAERPPWPAP